MMDWSLLSSGDVSNYCLLNVQLLSDDSIRRVHTRYLLWPWVPSRDSMMAPCVWYRARGPFYSPLFVYWNRKDVFNCYMPSILLASLICLCVSLFALFCTVSWLRWITCETFRWIPIESILTADHDIACNKIQSVFYDCNNFKKFNKGIQRSIEMPKQKSDQVENPLIYRECDSSI